MRLDQIRLERISGTFEQAKIGNVVVITKDTKQGRDTYNIRVVGSNFVSDKWHDLDPVAAQRVLYVLFQSDGQREAAMTAFAKSWRRSARRLPRPSGQSCGCSQPSEQAPLPRQLRDLLQQRANLVVFKIASDARERLRLRLHDLRRLASPQRHLAPIGDPRRVGDVLLRLLVPRFARALAV